MEQVTKFDCPQGCGRLVRCWRQNVRVLACPRCGAWVPQAEFDRIAAGVLKSLAQEIVDNGMQIPEGWKE